MKPTLVQAIQSLSPNAEFAIQGQTLTGLRWISGFQPTDIEIEQELARLEQAYRAAEYQRLRASEYPSLDALLVALWESSVEGRPLAATELQRIREIIKAKYPKPLVQP